MYIHVHVYTLAEKCLRHLKKYFSGPIMQGFKEFIVKDAATAAKIAEMKAKVEEFSKRFPMPGFDDK